MWCCKETNIAKLTATNTIFTEHPISGCKEPKDAEKVKSDQPKPIVIVEPRILRKHGSTTTSSSTSTTNRSPEWFMLPHTVDVSNDVMRLVSSLSTVVQILTRMTNAAAQELRQHPEREEGFQGLRLLLNYADQMYTTLLQPQPFSEERPVSSRLPGTQPYSLFHHLFEPRVESDDRIEESSSRLSSSTDRSVDRPFRTVAVAANPVVATVSAAAVAATSDLVSDSNTSTDAGA